jgi:hypothetical protein
MRRAVSGLLLWAVALVGEAHSTHAAELLMFEEPGCVWCRRWHAEIGPGYPRTVEGQMAPLRRLDIREQAGAGAILARPVVGTPTFVLIDDGREIGRVVGYPGSEFFYGLLGELLGRIPERSTDRMLRPDAGGARAADMRM